mmetsp:Transcript_2662/g.5934  ORF Transcript_2662/g.5934 Transcript_2662/m.5934 type:complete len:310 (+) Transcript_2662:275-1204(+)
MKRETMALGMRPVEGIHSVALKDMPVRNRNIIRLRVMKKMYIPQSALMSPVLCPNHVYRKPERVRAVVNPTNETPPRARCQGPVTLFVPSLSIQLSFHANTQSMKRMICTIRNRTPHASASQPKSRKNVDGIKRVDRCASPHTSVFTPHAPVWKTDRGFSRSSAPMQANARTMWKATWAQHMRRTNALATQVGESLSGGHERFLLSHSIFPSCSGTTSRKIPAIIVVTRNSPKYVTLAVRDTCVALVPFPPTVLPTAAQAKEQSEDMAHDVSCIPVHPASPAPMLARGPSRHAAISPTSDPSPSKTQLP